MFLLYGAGCLLMAVVSVEMTDRFAKTLAALSSFAFFMAFFSNLVNGS